MRQGADARRRGSIGRQEEELDGVFFRGDRDRGGGGGGGGRRFLAGGSGFGFSRLHVSYFAIRLVGWMPASLVLVLEGQFDSGVHRRVDERVEGTSDGRLTRLFK